MSGVCWGIIGGCFTFACVMDYRTRTVYNFVWWISGAAALVLLFQRRPGPDPEQWIELAVFLGLQLFLFSTMYGRADCYAFCVCGIAEAAAGMGLKGYLIHMLLSFFLLALVQGMRRNIAETGNLKYPVPFLPYITLAFWTLLWYHNIC
ncbi:MAG: hypothetical protein ACI4HQ_06430 [Acetatifactor sp.]